MKIRHIVTGNEYPVVSLPIYTNEHWDAGDQRFYDPTGTEYEIVESAILPVLSPVAFKMCFTASERIAIKALRGTDPMVDDWMTVLDDPRLSGVDLNLASTQAAIDYLVGKVEGFTVERAAQVKIGRIL